MQAPPGRILSQVSRDVDGPVALRSRSRSQLAESLESMRSPVEATERRETLANRSWQLTFPTNVPSRPQT